MAINKTLVFVFLAVIIISSFLFFPKKISQACFGSNCFSVELATTNAQREKGLMNRPNLDKKLGMLFVFDKEDIYPFWMKNTLIPLDIIWIDKDYKIVFVAENVQPCKTETCLTIDPKTKAKYALEINGGLTKEFNIKSGDLVQISPGL